MEKEREEVNQVDDWRLGGLPEKSPLPQCGYHTRVPFLGSIKPARPIGGPWSAYHSQTPTYSHTVPTCTPVPTGSARSTRKARSPPVEVTLM